MKQQTHKNRRRQLTKTLSSGSCALISSGSKVERTPHTFRAWSDFIYYTGLNIEGAVLLVFEDKEFLFVTRGNDLKNLWDGLSYDENELHELGFSEFYFMDELSFFLQRLQIKKIHTNKIQSPDQEDFSEEMKKIRLIKEEGEIHAMKAAAEISAQVHRELSSFLCVGQSEKEISLFMDSRFRTLGSERNAYESIVASHSRACTLHAPASARRLQQDELVLVDAACEWDFYAADVTRTYSSSRRLSTAQEKIYDLVLAAQKAVLSEIKPGKTLNQLHRFAQEHLRDGLGQLGIQQSLLSELFPHRTSHWLGLDVHDTRGVSHDLPLQENMCFTVEPGLYFRDDQAGSLYKGIGVRIEDNVLVTAHGCEILTHPAPKEKADLFF